MRMLTVIQSPPSSAIEITRRPQRPEKRLLKFEHLFSRQPRPVLPVQNVQVLRYAPQSVHGLCSQLRHYVRLATGIHFARRDGGVRLPAALQGHEGEGSQDGVPQD